MRMPDPLVSIIVPSFNQGRFLRETLESIFAQDYRPLEVLVFDGGSKDETLDVLRSFDGFPELKWRSEPDAGVSDAVNKGLRTASGEIAAIQSSDDVYLPGALSAVVRFFQDHESAALVYGDVEYIDEKSRVTGRTTLPGFNLGEAGEWREEVSYAADSDYWLRIAMKFPVEKIERVVARYRYHPDQRDSAGERVARDWERAVVEAMRGRAMTARSGRFAKMGIHLTYHHYLPRRRWIARTWRLYRAAAANPSMIVHKEFPKTELLIGREPVWKLLSRVKRGLGFKPRTA